MGGAMEFEFSVRGAGSSAKDSRGPLGVLLVGHYGAAGSAALESAPMRRVDLDSLDQLWDVFAPELTLELDGFQMTFEPRELEDFHPDKLVQKLPAFAELRALRRRLQDTATADAALAEVLAAGSTPPQTANAASEEAPVQEDEGSLFGRLLGAEPDAGSKQAGKRDAQTRTGSNSIDALLRSVVAPHVVPGPDARVDAAISSIDLGLSDLLGRILADPGFMALEGRWRAIYHLVQSTELDESTELRVLSVSHAALLSGLPDDAGQLDRCGLWVTLAQRYRASSADQPLSLLALDQQLQPTPDDLALLGTVGAIADQLDCAVLAAASPEFLGANSQKQLKDPHSWRDTAELPPMWAALREAPFAHRIGLLLPRLLARLPYGAATDPVSTFDFEEINFEQFDLDKTPLPVSTPVAAVASLLINEFAHSGWSMDPVGALDIEDLPVFSYRVDGETRLQAATEQLMSETALGAALARGIMPLGGFRNQDRARLVRLQSIAEPLTALRGPWHSQGGN